MITVTQSLGPASTVTLVLHIREINSRHLHFQPEKQSGGSAQDGPTLELAKLPYALTCAREAPQLPSIWYAPEPAKHWSSGSKKQFSGPTTKNHALRPSKSHASQARETAE